MSPLDQLAGQITRTFGLSVRGDWRSLLERAASEEGLGDDVQALAERASRDPVLFKRLAGLLTINETHFLRHPAHFDYLLGFARQHLGADPERVLRIWSAGCASGEEPYSAALVLDRHLGPAALERVEILATDIDGEAITKALAATYTSWSFRSTPAWVLGSYFQGGDRGRFHLDPRIRKQVLFEQSGIEQKAYTLPTDGVDLIFFRNVGIYFEPAALERLYSALSRVLAPHGAMLTGASDPVAPASLFRQEWIHGFALSTPVDPTAPIEAAPPPCQRPALRPAPPTRAARRRVTERSKAPSPPPPPRAELAPPEPTAEPAPEVAAAISPEIATGLAHEGRIEEALEMASALMEAEPLSAPARCLRGQIQLAASDWPAAIADLRQAVFLEAGDPLCRYWYATALVAGGSAPKALGQLAHLEEQLARLEEETLLADGETRAAELLEAVHFLAEGIR